MDYEEISVLWRDGQRRLATADPAQRVVLDRVTDAIVAELRRRLGGRFSRQELAEFYERDGIDWCLGVAMRAAPSDPEAWDLTTVAGAAFARYAREASDYRTERLAARPPGMEPE